MPRPKSLGQYAPLSASYYRDDAILEAGERAELLFVRGLAYCSETPSDGFISERQLVSVVGIGMRDVAKRASLLVSVGVWERVEGGYIVRSWLRWNKSAEEIGRHLKKDRERKAAAKDSGIPADSARNPVGIRADSSDQSNPVHVTTSQSNPLADSAGTDTSPPPPAASPREAQARADDGLAIVDVWKAARLSLGQTPSRQMLKAVAANALEALRDHDYDLVAKAAHQAGQAGFVRLDIEISKLTAAPPAQRAADRPPTTDVRVHGALALAAEYEAAEQAAPPPAHRQITGGTR